MRDRGRPGDRLALYDTAYTERYLGLPEDGLDIYAHHSLVELAAEPVTSPTRPARCCWCTAWRTTTWWPRTRSALRGPAEHRPPARRAPLTGATHMAANGTAERLLPLELDFLRTHLG